MYFSKVTIFWAIAALSVSENPLQFFSKFNQNKFVIKYERMEMTYNPEVVKHGKCVTFKYNRTTAVTNVTFELKKDVNYDVLTIVQVYKFMSNEYRHFPIRFEVDYCLAFEQNMIGMKNAMICGNFSGCPVKKGVIYHVCNFQPDGSKFPPLMPSGSYMIESKFVTKEDETPFMSWQAYGLIDYPIKY